MDFQNPGFWRLKAPETSIWTPEGAFGPLRLGERRTTGLGGTTGSDGRRNGIRTTARGDPQAVGEAALAADLITA